MPAHSGHIAQLPLSPEPAGAEVLVLPPILHLVPSFTHSFVLFNKPNILLIFFYLVKDRIMKKI